MRTAVRTIVGSILVVSLFLLFSSGCASRVVYVHKGPPPLKVEVKSVQPHPKAVWISGHWAWNRHTDSYVWILGHWAAKPKGKVWAPGHWKQGPRGWVWVKGHWVKGHWKR